MSKCNKIISSIVLVCFIFNTAVSDLAFGQSLNYAASDKLAPPDKLDDISGLQANRIVKIKYALENYAWMLAGNDTSLDESFFRQNKEPLRLKAKAAFEAGTAKDIKMHFFFNEMPPKVFNRLCVRCDIRDEKGSDRFYVVLGLEREDDKGFPIHVYTQNEAENTYKDLSRLARELPRRNEKDQGTLDGYEQHQKGADIVLKEAYRLGLVKEPLPDRFNHRERVIDLFRKLSISVSNPKHLTPIEDRSLRLVKMTPLIRELMAKLPKAKIRDAKGEEHELIYYATSSNNTIHIFVGEKTFDILTNQNLQNIGAEEKEIACMEVAVQHNHELGVPFGMVPDEIKPYGIGEGNGYAINEMDRRAVKLANNPKAKFKKLEVEIVDLDTNLATRDYAAGGTQFGATEIAKVKSAIENFDLATLLVAHDMVTDRQIGTIREREIEAIRKMGPPLEVYGWDSIQKLLKRAKALPIIEARITQLKERVNARIEAENKGACQAVQDFDLATLLIAHDMVTDAKVALREREIEAIRVMERPLGVYGWDSIQKLLKRAEARPVIEARIEQFRERANARIEVENKKARQAVQDFDLATLLVAHDMVTDAHIALREREIEAIDNMQGPLGVVGWDQIKKLLIRAQAQSIIETRISALTEQAKKSAQAKAQFRPGSTDGALTIFGSYQKVFFNPEGFTNKDHELYSAVIGLIGERTRQGDRRKLAQQGDLRMKRPGLYVLTPESRAKAALLAAKFDAALSGEDIKVETGNVAALGLHRLARSPARKKSELKRQLMAQSQVAMAAKDQREKEIRGLDRNFTDLLVRVQDRETLIRALDLFTTTEAGAIAQEGFFDHYKLQIKFQLESLEPGRNIFAAMKRWLAKKTATKNMSAAAGLGAGGERPMLPAAIEDRIHQLRAAANAQIGVLEEMVGTLPKADRTTIRIALLNAGYKKEEQLAELISLFATDSLSVTDKVDKVGIRIALLNTGFNRDEQIGALEESIGTLLKTDRIIVRAAFLNYGHKTEEQLAELNSLLKTDGLSTTDKIRIRAALLNAGFNRKEQIGALEELLQYGSLPDGSLQPTDRIAICSAFLDSGYEKGAQLTELNLLLARGDLPPPVKNSIRIALLNVHLKELKSLEAQLAAAKAQAATTEETVLRAHLGSVIAKMVPPTGGILAADESTGSAGKRLDSVGLPNTPENRQAMRELMLTVPGQKEAGISAVILFDETFDNVDRQGRNLVRHHLLARGILPGIKTDRGLIPDPDSPGEMIPDPKGLEQLPKLLETYSAKGAVFTKWRVTVAIDPAKHLPTDANIRKNMEVLARSAKMTQEAGLVPIVEPEVLLDGAHDINVSYKVTTRTLEILFEELVKEGVWLDGVVLKTSMILSGDKAANRADSQTVGYETLKGLLKSVPFEVPAIVFLSGGQGDDEVNENLNGVSLARLNRFEEARNEAASELASEGKKEEAVKLRHLVQAPWQVSYSFGRGLQRPGLKVWQGKPENFEAAQEALRQAGLTTQNARLGQLHDAQMTTAQAAVAFDYASAKKQYEAEGFITPDEATKELNALPVMGNLNRLKEYYAQAEKGSTAEQFFDGLSDDLKKVTDILQKTRPMDELSSLTEQGVGVKQLDILRAVSELILQLRQREEGVDNIEHLRRIRNVFVRNPEISQLLIKYFEMRFDPEESGRRKRGLNAGLVRRNELMLEKRVHSISDINDYIILDQALAILIATVRTDYFVEKRTGLFLRIDPRSITKADYSGALMNTPPVAITWVHVPYGAFGATSRYGEITRGGLRFINPRNTDWLNKILVTCVGLSLEQDDKNIGITPRGFKGTYSCDKALNGIAASIGYVDGLINTGLINEDRIVMSPDGVDSLMFGPDESTDWLANIATTLARMKGLKEWRLIMTGKSIIGVSHKDNGLLDPPEDGNRVTSQGVVTHAIELARYAREKGIIASSANEPLIVPLTGGLEGDVGSGDFERLIHHYGEGVNMPGWVDVSGVVVDPKGVPHNLILAGYKTGALAKTFSKDKLHSGGFVSEAKQGSGEECYVTLGFETLRVMNTRPLDPKILRELKIEDKYKEQAGLKKDEDLIVVLDRDSRGRPTRVKVHSVYLRDAIFFMINGDMLVTGGGVPRSIDDQNWPLFFDWDEKPVCPTVVHGANIFMSEVASVELEKRGVLIEPAVSANSVGVEVSDRVEVALNMLFEIPELTRPLMGDYLKQSLAKFCEDARWKFWALRMDAEDRPGRSVVTDIMPAISEEMIYLSEYIMHSDIVGDREISYSREAKNRLQYYFPELGKLDKGYNSTLDRVFDKMPAKYLATTTASLIAKEAVLNLGLGTIGALAKEHGVQRPDVIKAYLAEADRLDTYAKVKAIVDNKENLAPSVQISKLRTVRGELREAVSKRLAAKAQAAAETKKPDKDIKTSPEELLQQEKMARENLALAITRINDSGMLTEAQKEELCKMLSALFERALPLFRDGAAENPIYHNTQVLDNMVQIVLGDRVEGEKVLSYNDIKNALILALLHDIGNADCEIEKVVSQKIKDELKKGDTEKTKKLAKQSIDFRLEHMEKGPALFRRIVKKCADAGALRMIEADVDLICEAIKIHDNPSIESVISKLRNDKIEIEYSSKPEGYYLLSFEGQLGLLVELLRDADRLFMVSYQGVIKDLKDDENNPKITPENIRKRLSKNKVNHSDEYIMYEKAGRDDGKFIKKTLYRNAAGYRIYEDSDKVIEEEIARNFANPTASASTTSEQAAQAPAKAQVNAQSLVDVVTTEEGEILTLRNGYTVVVGEIMGYLAWNELTWLDINRSSGWLGGVANIASGKNIGTGRVVKSEGVTVEILEINASKNKKHGEKGNVKLRVTYVPSLATSASPAQIIPEEKTQAASSHADTLVLDLIQDAVEKQELSRQERFDKVYPIVQAKYPTLIPALERLKPLIEEPNADTIILAVNKETSSSLERLILRRAFLGESEGLVDNYLERLGHQIIAWLEAGDYARVREQLLDSGRTYLDEASYRDYELKPPKNRDLDGELTVLRNVLRDTADGRRFLNSEYYTKIIGVTRVRFAMAFRLPMQGVEIKGSTAKAEILSKIYKNPTRQDADYRSTRRAMGDRMNPEEFTVIKIRGSNEYLIIDKVNKFASYISASVARGALVTSFHIYNPPPISVDSLVRAKPSTEQAGEFNLRDETPVEPVPMRKLPVEKPEFGQTPPGMPADAPAPSPRQGYSEPTLLSAIMELVPVKWIDGWLSLVNFAMALVEAGVKQHIFPDENSVLIFSEKATFGEKKPDGSYEEGVGPILPSFIRSGVRVAVVAPDDKQKALIDGLNEGLRGDRRIIYADNVAEVTARVHAARYYFLKVEGEPDAGVGGVTSITIMVKKIIDAIGKIINITDAGLIEQMHKAARMFAEAA